MTAITTHLGRLFVHFGPHFDDKIKSKHSSDPGASAYWHLLCRFLSYSLVAQTVESPCNAGDLGSIPGSGRSPGEGNGNPLQYSCLEIPTERAAWQVTVHGVTKSQKQLSDLTFFSSQCFNFVTSTGCLWTSNKNQTKPTWEQYWRYWGHLVSHLVSDGCRYFGACSGRLLYNP